MKNFLIADPEDVEDVLQQVGRSFAIQFSPNELTHIDTFGQLCGHIIQKIDLEDKDDCTTQQAFYRIREVIGRLEYINSSEINPDVKLSGIIPRRRRRRSIARLEDELGFKIKILRPKHILVSLILLFCLGSIVVLLFSWQLGLAGFIASILLFRLANHYGGEFDLMTVGELAERMSQDNYVMSRRNPLTINKNEVAEKIEQLFIRHLGLKNTHKHISSDTIIADRGS